MSNRFVLFLASLAALVPPGCGGRGADSGLDKAAGQPGRMVFIEMSGLPPDPRLPSAFLRAGPVRLAASRLAENLSESVPSVLEEYAAACLRSDRLVMLIDCPVPVSQGGRDNISITTSIPVGGDTTGAFPVPHPEDLLSGIDCAGWASLSGRQDVIGEIAARFGPDVIIARFSPGSVDTALTIGSKWLGTISTTGGTLVILSPPDSGWYRGWVVLAGSGIDTIPPTGLTPSGILNTAALLTGLDPILPLSRGVPAIGTLLQGGKILP